MKYHCTSYALLYVVQVYQPDGNNGYNAVCEEEAAVQRQRNRPKKLSPRMR